MFPPFMFLLRLLNLSILSVESLDYIIRNLKIRFKLFNLSRMIIYVLFSIPHSPQTLRSLSVEIFVGTQPYQTPSTPILHHISALSAILDHWSYEIL